MPQWCDKHKQHTIDEACWKCDQEASPDTRARVALAEDIASRIAGSTSGQQTKDAIVAALLAFPTMSPTVKLLAKPPIRDRETP